jgi:flagellar hook-length control protein FliK
MTDIGTIQTAQVKTGNAAAAAGAAGGAAALSGTGTGVFGALGGLSFMDMIFARGLAAAQTQAADGATAQNTGGKPALFTQIAFTANTQSLSAEQLAAVAPDTLPGISSADMALLYPEIFAASADADVTLTGDAALSGQSGEAAAGLVTTEALPPVPLSARKEIADIIQTLLKGVPQQNGRIDESALIATPLTPADLAALAEQVAAQTGTDKALVAAVIKILPPQIKAAIKLTPQVPKDGDITGAEASKNAAIGVPVALNTPMNDTKIETADDLAARLNAVIPDGDGKTAPQFTPTPTVPKDGAAPNNAPGTHAAAQAAHAQAVAQNAAGGSAVAAQAGASLDSLLNSAGWDSIYPDGLDWTQTTGAGAHNSLTLTGPSQFASLVANAQSATAPHPATQMVAATITKATGEGETKSMTLKLDPPELGRVEVRLDFGKEKGMKAHIVVEKPETYMMLQRDAHVLERALQDSGLAADGGGLSFSLSQDGGLFDDGHSGGNRGGGGSGGRGDGGEAEQIIETTMNWSVDANGMTHYDILA